MTISEYNQDKGLYMASKCISNLVFAINSFIILAGAVFFIIKKINPDLPVPPFLSDYIYKDDLGNVFKAIFNTALLSALNYGHNKYMKIYYKTILLEPLGGSVDFIIKVLILAASVFQLMCTNIIPAACMVLYFGTFLRNIVLLRNMPEDDPLYPYIKELWIPHNKRHNIVMAVWNVIYYLLCFKVIYFAAAWLMNLKLEAAFFEASNIMVLHKAVIFTVTVIFDLYWIFRVLIKVEIKNGTFFDYEKLSNILEKSRKYNEDKIKQK